MKSKLITIASTVAASLAFASVSFAHCDSMDGPVVKDAQHAIAAKDITRVLKWISPEDQAEVARVFKTTIDIREKGDEVQKVADTYFFESLVRIHRKSEGEGFTGLKPAGSAEPPIVAADKALADGDIDKLADKISTAVRGGIVARFRDAYEKKKRADDTVEEGREFVESYIQFTHFVEAIHHVVSHGADPKHQDADSK
jgi:hypothetical protein